MLMRVPSESAIVAHDIFRMRPSRTLTRVSFQPDGGACMNSDALRR